MIDTKKLGVVMSLDCCIKKTESVIEGNKDALKRSRSTTAKQSRKNVIEYFEAVQHHLKQLKEMEGMR